MREKRVPGRGETFPFCSCGLYGAGDLGRREGVFLSFSTRSCGANTGQNLDQADHLKFDLSPQKKGRTAARGARGKLRLVAESQRRAMGSFKSFAPHPTTTPASPPFAPLRPLDAPERGRKFGESRLGIGSFVTGRSAWDRRLPQPNLPQT